MRIPKKLKICGHTYKVETKKEPTVDSEVVFGACYQKEQKIVLQEGILPARQQAIQIQALGYVVKLNSSDVSSTQ